MIQQSFLDWNRVLSFIRRRTEDYRVLVVGDIMLDRYFFGDVRRISPEAPVPIVQIKETKDTLGGAGNVCHNLARLGCKVHVAGITGNDYMRTIMVELLEKQGISDEGLMVAADRPTISKTRVIGGHQQILRLDFEETHHLGRTLERKLQSFISDMVNNADSIIISDYAKGVCTPAICQTVIKASRVRQIPVVIDPKGTDWRKYKGAYLITPNLKELGEAVHGQLANDSLIVERAAQKLRNRYQLENMVVTRSDKGLSLINETDSVHVPTTAQEVFDVSGAGDTVAAVLGAALADGIHLADAAHLANLAAGVVVGKLGTYAISQEELWSVLAHQHPLQAAAASIVD